ncbi:DNA sulfur modification protein DndB [Mycobacteroides abscessus]|uniref:DNA sulfur modification protein DndB n=1 Tax=Mycobacteroides abscessus TaxID=36809 RepID=UPI001F40BEBE|nr:DNA sulfur modification protein DndB [Mycobacteroides abscessus]MDM2496030.1 DNA sulfur modification protein DndB [Mycobacteroides abscessus]MDM2514611.1 DNA sulfur modification protein DndB [Mycobacteroides abscessus]MDM2523601.1 DNA sulfur modification protein DndB [Mycobacteroides abscessus]MDM2529772.1 DNA sulfur modification protein DndB [Mycobacteroides abscessus]MDM2531375.1 DNA sulfur modification protein DndB [Mycobacteroides abscessus]
MTHTHPTLTQQSVSPGRARTGEFEWVFPAIRGVQAGREYYVTMCPLRLIPRMFLFDEEELTAEMRAQRTLNKGRVPEIARYIVENSDSYVFSALTASVDVDVRFDPLATDGPSERVGTLIIPMSARFVINDGQHRRAAIQQALAENPALGDESIAIVLFLDIGLERCQQMFADLNRYAVRPAKSIGVLYDHRDEMSALTRLVVLRSPFLRDLTEMETSNLAQRSRKLFTLSALHAATKALLDGIEESNFERRVDLASKYWELVIDQFPEWDQVFNREITAGEVRRDFIHTHGIVLHALGKVGNSLLSQGKGVRSWSPALKKLRDVDWHRASSTWEGRAVIGGRVSKSAANVLLTTAAMRAVMGLPLPPDEQRAEDAFGGGN